MENEIKKGILNGSIPSAAYDTAAISSCEKYGDQFIPTGRNLSRSSRHQQVTKLQQVK
jgi:hypothetical protein